MKKVIVAGLIAAMMSVLMAGCAGTGKQDSAKSSGGSDPAGVQSSVQGETTAVGKLMEPAETFAGGDGSEADPYQISTAEELYRFAYVMDGTNFSLEDEEFAVVFREKYYVLTADIVINDAVDFENWQAEAPEYGWSPVPAFSGQLDGQGHTISGLYCEMPEGSGSLSAGFFNGLYGGTVENLKIEKSMLITGDYGVNAGLLTGSADQAQIRNCQISGKVICRGGGQGGIVGRAAWTVISDSSFAGEVNAQEGGGTGGVAGNASGCVIVGCTNEGAISARGGSSAYAGGILGSLASSAGGPIGDAQKEQDRIAAVEAWIEAVRETGIGLKNCTNAGAVYSASDVAGGIVGIVSDGLSPEYQSEIRITDCINEGAVSSDSELLAAAAGICGEYQTNPVMMGAEKVTGALTLVNCINRGDITAKEVNVAGILGMASMKSGALAVDTCANEGILVTGVSDGFISHIGGIAGTISVFEGVSLRFENITDRTAYDMKDGQIIGGIVGAVTVAESKEEELSFVIKNCKGLGSFDGDEGATYGALCGSFMEGVFLNDFEGVFEIAGCECASEVPAVGTSGSITDKFIALIKTAEE